MPDPLILTMSAFLTLANQCGEGIAPSTLANLQAHESGFNVLALNINGNGGGTVKGIKTKSQAIALAKTLYERDISFDAGIAQINSKNFKWLGVTPETVFDPCEAIKAQTRLLRSYSKYNTGDENNGFTNGYVNKVVAGQERVRNAMRMAEAEARPSPDVSRETAPSETPTEATPPPAATQPFGPRKFIVKEYP
jgi:type IV secretion system protein VirB1